MKFKVKSEIYVDRVGKMIHEHVQEFDNNSNVFGRALEYHEYMNKMFPGCRYRLIEAREI